MHPRFGLALGLLALALAAPTTLLAGTYYVDDDPATCSDTNPNRGSISIPYCTIQTAINEHYQGGDVILVKPGTYWQEVQIQRVANTSEANRFILRADNATGSVTIDGSDLFTNTPSAKWEQYLSSPVFRTKATQASVISAGDTVWYVDNKRVLRDHSSPPVALELLPDNTMRYDPATDAVYMNLDGSPADPDPGNHATYVCRRNNNIRINGTTNYGAVSYVTVEGFTTTRAKQIGIYVQGDDSPVVYNTYCTIQNCTNSYSGAGQGIRIRYGDNCRVINTKSFRNTYYAGIYVGASRYCTVEGCESYENDHPYGLRRGVNGIRIADTSTDITVDNNRVHHNEDTGLDIIGASNVLCRNNVSYYNIDHGYDHNNATNATHIGDVSFGNDHDGISIENTSSGIKIYNCIIVSNMRKRTHLETGAVYPCRELFYAGTSGLESNYNIIWNPGIVQGQSSFPLVKYAGTNYYTLSDYQTGTGKDLQSLSGDPLFADTTAFNFSLRCNSPAIDNGRSDDLTNWKATDAVGNARYDMPVANSGTGNYPWTDRGAYEYSPNWETAPPSAVSAWATGGCYLIRLTWIAPGDDGDACGNAAAYDIFRDGSYIATMTAGTAGTAESYDDYVGQCSAFHSYRVDARDDRGNYRVGVTSNSVHTFCPPPQCIDEGLPQQPVVAGPQRLELGSPQPNPGRSAAFHYVIPAHLAGADLNIGLFDIAGRRVATVVSRKAEAGEHRADVSLGGLLQRAGVYLLQMKVGSERLTRTIVLMP